MNRLVKIIIFSFIITVLAEIVNINFYPTWSGILLIIFPILLIVGTAADYVLVEWMIPSYHADAQHV